MVVLKAANWLGGRHGWLPLWWLCLSVFITPGALAGEVVVVGGDSDVHRTFFHVLNQFVEQASPHTQLNYLPVEQWRDGAVGSSVDLVVTAGAVAARRVLATSPRVPVYCTLIPHEMFLALDIPPGAEVGALYVDQPLERLLLLSRMLLGEGRLGVLLGPHSMMHLEELDLLGKRLGIPFDVGSVGHGEDIALAVERLAATHRVVLTPPDPQVVNPSTAKTLILGSYLRKMGVVGYSHAMVKAGAAAAVYSTVDQLGAEAGIWVAGWLSSRSTSFYRPRYPTQFLVSVNYQVARALGIELPAEPDIVAALKRQGGAP